MSRYQTLQDDSVPSSAGSTSVLNTTHPSAHPIDENSGTSSPSYPPSPNVYLYERPNGCFGDYKVNRPQIRALAAGAYIFISGGMSLAWSIALPSNFADVSKGALRHLQVCWFLAVIIGACISGKFIEKFSKRSFDIIAGVLVIAKGILFYAFPTSVWCAVVARYCDGLANGLAVIPTIVVASERSVKRFRGLVVSLEQGALICGVTLYLSSLKSGFDHGLGAIIFGIATLAFTFLFPSESPISYLRKGDDQGALNTLRQMQRPFIVTTETYALHNECKLLLEEDIARGRDLNMSQGVIPAITLCIFRGLLSMSLLVSIAWSLSANSSGYLPGLYIFARMMGVSIAQLVTLDNVGRKAVTAFSLIVSGGLLLVFLVVVTSSNDSSPKVILMAYHVLTGVAAPASTCYLGEAFSISVKPFFTTVAIVFENIVLIIILLVLPVESITNYGYVLGALQIIFAMFFLFRMPETKRTTLRQALAMFTNKWNLKLC